MRLLFALLVGLFVFAAPVLADGTGPPATTIVADDVVITAPGPAPAVAPAPVVVADDGALVAGTVGEIAAIVTNHRAAGGIIVAILIIAALLKLLTKHTGIATLLERTGKTWIRPVLSVLTGAVGALASTLALGIRDPVSLIAAVVSGVAAGLGASGAVDLARATLFPDTRTKRSTDEGALAVAAEAIERQIVDSARSADLQHARGQIAQATTLPAAKRVEALAALLKGKA